MSEADTNTYLITTTLAAVIIVLIRKLYEYYFTKKRQRETIIHSKNITEKVQLIDNIIKDLNIIKSQNSIIQQSLNGLSRGNNSVEVDLEE